MKILHLFLGLFFLISITVSPSVEAGNPIPAGLQSAIDRVKAMKRSGASKKDIASYVTRTVVNRLTFLNHFSNRMSSDPKLEKKLKFFNTWREKGDMVDETFSSAVWAWENRMGQCNEGASTAFHILVMAYESTDEVTTVTKGDHRFVILGDVKNLPDPFSADDLRKLNNTYVVDPWDGKSFSTKDLSFFDRFQHGEGNPVARPKYRFYKRKYNKWLTWCKKNPVEFQKWLYGLSDTEAEEKIEHEDTMNFMLALHQKEIEELKALKEQILEKGKADLKTIKSNIIKAGVIQLDLKKYETLILALVDQGNSYCDEARLLHQKIMALSAAMEDGESLVNSKINLAKDRKADCKTEADGIFIRNNYQAAQDAFAIMKTAKEAAFENLVEINIKLEQIKTIDNQLNQHDGNWWQEQRRKHEKFLENIPQYLDQLETGLKDAKGFPGKVQALKAKIEDSKRYYIQDFPGAGADFDQLIKQISSIRLFYVIDPAGLADLSQEYETAQKALDTPTGNNARLFRGAPPLINCFSNSAPKKVMDKIDEAFLRGLLVLKTNDDLRGGCKEKAEVREPPKDSDESMSENTDGSTPEIPAVDPDNKNDQDTPSNSMGGLIIVGPVELVSGQGVTYTACNRAGVPYTSGSFSWGFSDESVMSLGKSGNPVSGSGFKAGNVMIFVHYDGGDVYTGTAWLDVKIKEKKKENNLFSTSGGEDNEDSENVQGSLFSSAGGEDNKLKNQCDRLSSNIYSALDRGDTDSAQSFTNQAAALGCDIDPGVLAQMENIEKEQREQRERQLADAARDKEQQKEKCLKIRRDIISAINQKNVDALQYFAGIAANAGCNINTSRIHQIIAEIKDERRQQQAQRQAQSQGSRQTQHQTNWTDVMNMIVKGVKDVQQGHSKPPIKNSSEPVKTHSNPNIKTCSTCPKRNPGTSKSFNCKAPGNTKVVSLTCHYAKNGMLEGEVFYGKTYMIRYNSFKVTGNSSYLSAVWNYDDKGKLHGKEQQWWRANVTRFIKTWDHGREVEKCFYDKNGQLKNCMKY